MQDFQQCVLLTRSRESSEEFVRILAEKGIAVEQFPLITFAPPEHWEKVDNALESLCVYNGIIFSNADAVRNFFGRVKERAISPDELPSLYAIGEKTTRAIRESGYGAFSFPESVSPAEIVAILGDVTNKFYLQPGSNIASGELAKYVNAHGGKINQLSVFRTVLPPKKEILRFDRMLIEGAFDCIAFFSPAAVGNFMSLIPEFWQVTILIAVLDHATASAAVSRGLRVDIIAPESSQSSLANAIIERFSSSDRIDIDPTMHMDIG